MGVADNKINIVIDQSFPRGQPTSAQHRRRRVFLDFQYEVVVAFGEIFASVSVVAFFRLPESAPRKPTRVREVKQHVTFSKDSLGQCNRVHSPKS